MPVFGFEGCVVLVLAFRDVSALIRLDIHYVCLNIVNNLTFSVSFSVVALNGLPRERDLAVERSSLSMTKISLVVIRFLSSPLRNDGQDKYRY